MGAAAAASIPPHTGAAAEKGQPAPGLDFPIIDYHVHLSGALTIDKAVALANTRGVKFGIVEHPGPGYKLVNDEALRRYLDMLKKYPVYRGLSRSIPIGPRASPRICFANWTTS